MKVARLFEKEFNVGDLVLVGRYHNRQPPNIVIKKENDGTLRVMSIYSNPRITDPGARLNPKKNAISHASKMDVLFSLMNTAKTGHFNAELIYAVRNLKMYGHFWPELAAIKKSAAASLTEDIQVFGQPITEESTGEFVIHEIQEFNIVAEHEFKGFSNLERYLFNFMDPRNLEMEDLAPEDDYFQRPYSRTYAGYMFQTAQIYRDTHYGVVVWVDQLGLAKDSDIARAMVKRIREGASTDALFLERMMKRAGRSSPETDRVVAALHRSREFDLS